MHVRLLSACNRDVNYTTNKQQRSVGVCQVVLYNSMLYRTTWSLYTVQSNYFLPERQDVFAISQFRTHSSSPMLLDYLTHTAHLPGVCHPSNHIIYCFPTFCCWAKCRCARSATKHNPLLLSVTCGRQFRTTTSRF